MEQSVAFVKGVLSGMMMAAIFQLYLELVSGDGSLQGVELKIAVLIAVFFLSNFLQVAFMSGARRRPLEIAQYNFISWACFFLFVAANAFTLHRGLAPGVSVSLDNFLIFLVEYLALLGLPLTILNSLFGMIAWTRRTSS